MTTEFIALKNGRPSVTGDSESQVRRFAEQQVERTRRTAVDWGTTGRLFVGNRWTGWEVHPVKKLEG
jgi:hypothetical protein